VSEVRATTPKKRRVMRLVPGHRQIRTESGGKTFACICGWEPTGTKREREAAYTRHLDEAQAAYVLRCRVCGEERTPKQMMKDRPTVCRSCNRARVRAWVEAHPKEWERYGRKHYLAKKYGLTPQQADDLLAAQGGRCAICRSEPSDKRGFRMHVDHDHTTGQVRGILCGPCNRGIGQLGDDPDLLQAAADYLMRHRDVLRMIS
jgi:hypothetical protein